MARYVVAVDDSGGIEPLIKEFGSYAEGARPVITMASFLILEEFLEEFNSDWTALRRSMASDLSIDDPPPIHLRLMYGEKLPGKHRKKPNPYAVVGTNPPAPKAEFEQTLSWLEIAMSIIQEYSYRAKRGCGYVVVSFSREELAANLLEYFKSPELRAEMMFIRHHSVRPRQNMYKNYQKKMASAILTPFTQLLGYLDQVMHLSKSTANFLVDPFHDSAGLDTEELLDIIQKMGDLAYIESIKIGDPDESAVLQAADMIAYIWRRAEETQRKTMKPDKPLMDVWRKYPLSPLIPGTMQQIKAGLFARKKHWLYEMQAVHYALARREIEASDSNFAAEYLVSVEEFLERVKSKTVVRDATGKPVGTSILKDPSVAKGLSIL